LEELETFGLSEPVSKPEPKKRGRKKKEPTEPQPKRPMGRPKKDATLSLPRLYSPADWETYI